MDLGTAIPLGEGAMGRVLRAWDEELQRDVALKILRHDDRDAVERFLREARAQARVDHPNVARIYEVGYRDGRPCIVMQLVEGEPLDEALRERPVEEKVRVVRQVTEAVHAAHEAGLVHRDLKPSNVLVEETAEGELVPFVVDFGIARSHDAPGLTVTGQALGTPGYMSPEQARGEIGTLDRRSDVFSLGVVLYELLSGAHPFEAESQIGALVKVVQEDPAPLERVAPDLPADLRAIVERCLEKDPNRRYASARALTEDLDRWLRGEPVEARPVGAPQRMWRKVRRHPAAASLVAAALLVALGLGAWAVWTEVRAERRARLARELGERAREVEARMRFAHLAPGHDIRADRERVGRLVDDLTAGLESSPPLERGPRALAAGRAHLAFGRWREARSLLESAWESGFREPEVALSLGRALAEGFRSAREESVLISDVEARRAHLADARDRLAIPARELLDLAAARDLGLAPHERVYLGALLAFLGADFERAAELGAEASRAESWFYEGSLLRSEALLALAVASQGDQERGPGLQGLAAARDSAKSACSIARSDPRAHALRCRIEVWTMIRSMAEGQLPDLSYEEARTSCGRSLAMDPEQLAAYRLLADASWRMGKARAERGEDPDPALRAAVEAADGGLARHPGDPRLLAHRGNVAWVRGLWAYDRGEDSWESHLRRAVADFEAAARAAPGDPYLWLSLGHGWNRLGTRVSWQGGDPSAAFASALSAYERGLEEPGAMEARLANGVCQLLGTVGYAKQLKGQDPTEQYTGAERSCRRAIALDPHYLAARTGLGLAAWGRALWRDEHGDPAEESFREAEGQFRAVLERDPDRASTHLNLSSTLLDHARSRLDRGESAGETVDRVQAHVEPVRKVYPNEAAGLEARMALLRGRIATREGDDPETHFEEARRKVRSTRGDASLFLRTEVAAFRHQAEWLEEQGQSDEARALAENGYERVEGALADHEENVDLVIEKARLETLLARLSGEPEAARWRHRLVESRDRALALAPHREEELPTGSAEPAALRAGGPVS